jgi:hypothetical protein
MPSIKLEIPPEIAEKVENETLEKGSSRGKIILNALEEHYSLVPIISNENLELGFDSIMERQYLKFRLEEAGLRYQKLFREYEELKTTFEITIKKIKTSWWVRIGRKVKGIF